MLTYEVNGKITDATNGLVLFDYPAAASGNADRATSTAVPLSVANAIGFLSVEDGRGPLPIGPTGCMLYGWAAVIDAAAGLNWLYSTHDLHTVDGTDPIWWSMNDPQDDVFAYGTSWPPTAVVSTAWYVLPLATSDDHTRSDMIPSAGGGLRLGLGMGTEVATFPPVFGGSTSGGFGAFDTDEHFYSGGKNVPVRCLGVVTRSDFLVGNSLNFTTNGGHAMVLPSSFTLPATDTTDPGGSYAFRAFLLYKFLSTSALGAPMIGVTREPGEFGGT